jgi:large repetitive protein
MRFLQVVLNKHGMEPLFSGARTAIEGGKRWVFKHSPLHGQHSFAAIFYAAIIAMAVFCNGVFSSPAAQAATCNYATGQGTAPANWARYCWLDFSSFSAAQVDTPAGQDFSFTLADGSVLNFNMHMTAGSATALTPVVVPTWSGSPLGNTAFTGISGKPILYQPVRLTYPQVSYTYAIRNIDYKNAAGNAIPGFNFIIADGEATGLDEELVYNSNGGNWTIEGQAPAPYGGNDYAAVSNTGAQIKFTGISTSSYGSYIAGTREPSTVSVTVNYYNFYLGYEGAMIAIVPPETDLRLTKSNAATSVYVGNNTRYNLAVQNASAGAITGAVLSDPAMAGLTVTGVACAATPGVCTAGSTPTVAQLQSGTYALPLIPAGGTYALSVSATVTATSGVVANSATITAPPGTTDTDPSNNSATDTDTVAAAPIVATPDSVTGINGASGGSAVVNAFGGDTVAGVAAASANAVLSATTAVPARLAFNTASGAVDVLAGTAAGVYTFSYKLCEAVNLTNCAGSTVSVTVVAASILATADVPASVVGATGNAALINAFANDSFNSAALDLTKVTATVTSPASYAGVALAPATGLVSVAAGTPANSYSIGYRICENLNPTNCANSTIAITVTAASIVATADNPAAVNGASGNAMLVYAFANDSFNGSALDLTKVTATVTSPASTANVALNIATGAVSVAAGTPNATYTIGYKICENLNPTNCANAVVTVTVSAASITAANDAPAAVNGASGSTSVVNVFTNDTLNSAALIPASVTTSVTAPASNAGVVLNIVTGNVSVAAATPAGSYAIGYRICETLNPANCANAVVTVTVSAASITAANDAPVAVNGTSGSASVINAYANDVLNGVAVDPARITASITSAASNAGVTLNIATGVVSVAPATPAGSYSIGYQLCENLNPANCAAASITVTVTVAAANTSSTVSGTVFRDSNGDGRLGAGEPVQRGWVVELLQNGVVVGSAISNDQGFYKIDTPATGAHCDIQFRNPENGVVYSIIRNVDATSGGAVINQNLPIDPSGIVYDSLTRAPLAGASATLTDARGASLPAACFIDASQRIQRTGVSGAYRFDVVPGGAAACPLTETLYTVRITPPANYAAPSSVLPPQPGPFDPTGRAGPISISPSANPPTGAEAAIYYLDFRLAANDPDIIFNHIPLDPFLNRAALVVIKTTPKRGVSMGELVPYTITVRNTEAADRANVDVVDIAPQGFRYVPGSAAAEPVQADRQLIWRAQTIAANSSVSYSLAMVVGAGSSGGTKINTGFARDSISGADISNRSTAAVSITPSAVFDCAELLGKVFEDSNRNGVQDDGERGLPAVRLATVNGQLITTDSFGRYHLTCAAVPDARIGSNFVLKVDPRTLPAGYALTQDNPQSIRLTRGKFGEMNFGAAATTRTIIKLNSNAFMAGTDTLKADYAQKLAALPSTMSANRPAVLLHYTLGNDEDAAAASARLKALARQLETALHDAASIETSVARVTDAVGGE